jgi:predicted adenine nucleotide alpha hydrolase (AANH) superfamily ATPase
VNLRGDQKKGSRPSLLLHVCCAPCATHVIELLKEQFAVTAFFYNPNIYPHQERLRRARETDDLCQRLGVEIIAGIEESHDWSRRMEGRGGDREGGSHCAVCFRIRLARTAAVAEQGEFDCFASTLSVSPHKEAVIINRVGKKVARDLRTRFYSADFKKQDGFKKSCQLSQKYGLYRQDYCGCVYSLRERDEKKAHASGSCKTRAGGEK